MPCPFTNAPCVSDCGDGIVLEPFQQAIPAAGTPRGRGVLEHLQVQPRLGLHGLSPEQLPPDEVWRRQGRGLRGLRRRQHPAQRWLLAHLPRGTQLQRGHGPMHLELRRRLGCQRRVRRWQHQQRRRLLVDLQGGTWLPVRPARFQRRHHDRAGHLPRLPPGGDFHGGRRSREATTRLPAWSGHARQRRQAGLRRRGRRHTTAGWVTSATASTIGTGTFRGPTPPTYRRSSCTTTAMAAL